MHRIAQWLPPLKSPPQKFRRDCIAQSPTKLLIVHRIEILAQILTLPEIFLAEMLTLPGIF